MCEPAQCQVKDTTMPMTLLQTTSILSHFFFRNIPLSLIFIILFALVPFLLLVCFIIFILFFITSLTSRSKSFVLMKGCCYEIQAVCFTRTTNISLFLKMYFFKKRLRHRCFHVKFLRAPILKNICSRLLLCFDYFGYFNIALYFGVLHTVEVL